MSNSKNASTSARIVAAKILLAVTAEGHSLSDLLKPIKATGSAKDAALVQELCFGVCRFYFSLLPIIDSVLAKPLKNKDAILQMLLLIGCYQLKESNTPAYAVINETVAACDGIGRSFAKGLVNACLRRISQENTVCTLDEASQVAHPHWLYQRIHNAWPAEAQAIFSANNQRPPFTLRVNLKEMTRENYLMELAKADIAAVAHDTIPTAVILEKAIPVTDCPGFSTGVVSVQDAASQVAALLLQTQSGMRVLDAAAAPGGKSIHILQTTPDIHLLALDNDSLRLTRIEENCQRAKVQATIKHADSSQLSTWWDGRLFDRILLDAPCSALGVIRRHPDIKLLRQEQDIAALTVIQQNLLNRLAPCLAEDGLFLYSTCSILPEENQQQIARFLAENPTWQDVTALYSQYCPSALRVPYGMQILPGEGAMDGFYYALLQRKP